MDFERRGRVTKVEPLAGSFCQATVENADETRVHTLGFSQQLEHPPWPKVGEMIVVKGVIRNGKHLTSDWRRAT